MSIERNYGGQSMFAPLREVLVRRPDESFGDADPELWHYAEQPDLEAARQEHDALVGLLQVAGVEVLFHEETMPGMADAIYVFDPVLMTDHGVVVLQMGKEGRRGEEDPLARRLERLNIPVLGRLKGSARAEGGDLLWVDRCTLAVGVGRRTNLEGLHQLEEILSPLDVTVIQVELSDSMATESCFHLLSSISLVARDLAVVYTPLLSERFREHLTSRRVSFIEAERGEYERMATNVLALAPYECLMLEGNPAAERELERAGCKVTTFKGDEICHKAEGGPTCLTLPVFRQH